METIRLVKRDVDRVAYLIVQDQQVVVE